MYDVIVIGAGPAGLSAALLLGRCRRSVLVLDSGEPRNGASRGLHGYLTRDGVSPHELRRLGREDVAKYPTVTFADSRVEDARRDADGFEIAASGGLVAHARFLLLATGRTDVFPQINGFRRFYGRGVYHCPYCDGWEHRDRALGVYGNDANAADMALELLTWSGDVTIYSGGEARWDPARAVALSRRGIRTVDAPVIELQGGEVLERIALVQRAPRACEALFFCSECLQKSVLPERLGCGLSPDGSVICTGFAVANVPGLFVAGNVRGGLHLAVSAAAEGAEAAVAINDALIGFPLD